MALREEDREIDGVTYRCRQLAFTPSRKMLRRLFHIVGPTVGSALQGGGALNEVLDEDVNLGGAIASLAQRLSDEDVEYVHSVFVKQCDVKRGEGWQSLSDVSEVHFAEHGMLHWFKWIGFNLEVNYSDFFGADESVAHAVTERLRGTKSGGAKAEA